MEDASLSMFKEQFIHDAQWLEHLIAIFSIFITVILFNYSLKRCLNFVHRKTKDKQISPLWGIEVIPKSYLTLAIVSWLVGLSYILEIAFRVADIEPLIEMTMKLRSVAIILASGWLLFQWKGAIQKARIDLEKKRGTLSLHYAKIDLFGKIVSILLGVIVLLTTLSKIEYPLEGILTVGGAVAAAAGFAARDVGANFFGGLMIYLTQPFALGNRVKLPSNNIEGKIEQIGWYFTLVRNLEQQPIYVPNSIFTNNIVINLHRMKIRRFQEIITINYRHIEHLIKITEKIYKMLLAMDEVEKSQGPFVSYVKLNASSLDLQVIAFTQCLSTTAYLPLQQKILLNIGNILDECEAEITYPVMTHAQ